MNVSLSTSEVFSSIISYVSSTDSNNSANKDISDTEMKSALTVFEWDDGKVTKDELGFVTTKLNALVKKATDAGRKILMQWLSENWTSSGSSPGLRPTEAYRDILSSNFEDSPSEQQRASKINLALKQLDGKVSPARILEVRSLLTSVGDGDAVEPSRIVIEQWLKKHQMPKAPKRLDSALSGIISGLTWMSETDREIASMSLPGPSGKGALTRSAFLSLIKEGADTAIEERSYEDVMEDLTTEEPWMSEANRQRVKKFQELNQVLTEHLSNLQVFRVGGVDGDLYIVGRTSSNSIAGIVTSVVET